jgi:large subunit ribosomal protein L4
MSEAKRYVFDQETGEPEIVKLDPSLFDAEVHSDLLHRTVRTQLLNRRQGTSSTKTRAEVQGGGRKPWRQKGTGRARVGSRRSPLWAGGGIIFGPKPKSYRVKLPKKMRAKALISALSARGQSERVILLDRLAMEEPKTKNVVLLLERLGVASTALVVVATEEGSRAVTKSFSNLPGVRCLPVVALNVYDILRHEWLVLTEQALAELRERFSRWQN